MPTPLVSIIVPNYNHERYLPVRLESILAQSLTDFELILLDDCSPDGSVSILRRYASYPGVRLLVNQKNSGSTYRQWQKGLEISSGRYIWFAESDDVSAPDFLERMTTALEGRPAAGLAFCISTVINAEGSTVMSPEEVIAETQSRTGYDLSTWANDFYLPGREFCRRFMLPWNTIPNGSAVLFRRDALIRAGGVPQNLRLCGDWLAYCRTLAISDIAYVRRSMNFFRTHTNNVRSSTSSAEYFRQSRIVREEVADALGDRRASRLDWRAQSSFVQMLIASERRGGDGKVPLRRHLPLIVRSREMGARAPAIATTILTRELLARAARRLHVIDPVRRLMRSIGRY